MDNKCFIAIIVIIILIMMTTCPKRKNIENMADTGGKQEEEEHHARKQEEHHVRKQEEHSVKKQPADLSLNNFSKITMVDNKLVGFTEHVIDNNLLKPKIFKDANDNSLSGTTGTLYVKCSLPNLGSISNEDTHYLLTRLSPRQCQHEEDIGCAVEIPVLIPYKKLFTNNSLDNIKVNTRFNVIYAGKENGDKKLLLSGVENIKSSTYLSIKSKSENQHMCMDTSNKQGEFSIEEWGLGYRLRFDEEVPNPTNPEEKIIRKWYVSMCGDGFDTQCNLSGGIKRLCRSLNPDLALSFKFITFKKNQEH